MADQIQLRRDITTNWTSSNPILAQGEVGIDLTVSQIKIGDGATHWNSLAYLILPISANSPITGNGTTASPLSITTGNFTDSSSNTDGITISGGTNSIIGSGVTIAQQASTTSLNGYLKATDWNTFNNKQNAQTGSISGTSNQVTVSSNSNSVPSNITISLPTNIVTTSYNGLTLTANSTGFSIAGGTTSKTLTVSNTITLSASGDTYSLNIGTGGTLGSNAFTSTSYAPLASPTFTGIVTSPNVTITTLSTAGIVTNTSAGVLGTTATVPIANGGTNATSASTAIYNLTEPLTGWAANYVLTVNSGATGVIWAASATTPQSLTTTSTPLFAGLSLGSSAYTGAKLNIGGSNSTYSVSGNVGVLVASLENGSTESVYGIYSVAENTTTNLVDYGYGLYGTTLNTSTGAFGYSYGVYGSSATTYAGTYATGVYGGSTNTYSTGVAYGVYGNATTGSNSSYGVYGNANSTYSGNPATGPNGYGVYGTLTGEFLNNYGVYGITTADGSGINAYGVYGTSSASSSSAIAYGVYGAATYTSGGTAYGGYFNGQTYDIYLANSTIGHITSISTTGIAMYYNVTTGAVNYFSSSIRYKENVVNIGDLSAKLHDLRMVTFNYKEEYRNGEPQTTEYGAIAEEVYKILPDCVVYNSKGQIESIKYQNFLPLAINEIQRLRKDVTDLTSKLEKLEQNA
jgi:hypothetical protein